MKTKRWNQVCFTFITGVILILVISCTKSDTSTDQKVSYLAAGSYGDVIIFQIDKNTNTIYYNNETTNQTGSAALTPSSNPNLSGIYEISYGGHIYYAMELSEKMFVTTYPSGNQQNKFCFGVFSGLNYDIYTMNDLAGKYLFTVYNESSSQMAYGGYELLGNGTINWNMGPGNPSNFDEAVHFTGNSSTWTKSIPHPERIISSANGVNYTGIIYPGKIMLIDNGIGNGFTLGLKYPTSHVTQSSIAGTYKFIDITKHNETGVGYYTIPASGGNINFYRKYDGVTGEGTGVLTNFASIPQIKNAFKSEFVSNNVTYTTYFILLPGEMFLQFVVSPTGLVSNGIGVKIN